MIRTIATLITAAMLAGCVGKQETGRALPVEPRTEQELYSPVTLQNEFIRLELLPDTMGRLSRITFRASEREMLIPFEGRRTSYDPLFARLESNGMGLRDLYWGARGLGSAMNPMEITGQSSNAITFVTNNYGPLNASLRRTVNLPPDSTLIEISSAIIRQESEPRTNFKPWYNLVPAGSDAGVTVIPAKGGIRSIGTSACVYLDEDTLIGSLDSPDYFVAPARNWLATCFPEEKLVFAIYVPEELLQPEGFFYFWNGRTRCGNNVRTTEIILSGKDTKPGEPYNYSCRLGIFPGLSSIKEICGDTAIDCRIEEKADGWTIELDLCPGRRLPAGGLTLELRPVDGKGNIVKLGKIELESLPTAKVKTLSFTVPREKSLSGRYRINGILPSNESFELLQPVIVKP